jgi:hypothetical protein
LLLPAAARAQSLRDETSLRFVPASASLYSASLRNREHFERFLNSRAFARLKSLPLVQLGLAQLRAQWENNDQLAPVREFLAQPENQQLLSVLLDGVSHEVFVYGDARHGRWLGTLSQMSNRLNLAQMRAAQRGIDPDQAVAQAIAELLEKDPELLRVPGTVIGCRLSDTQAAAAQLERLEKLVTQLIESERPDLKPRFTRQQVGDSSFLTLKLDGTLVPWDEILSQTDLDDDTQTRLAARLQKITFTASLGLYDKYLLLAIGEDDSQLRSIGQGELLVDHPKMAPLAKYFDRKVTSVGYASEEFIQQVQRVDDQIDQMVEMLRTFLPNLPLDEDLKADLIKDTEMIAGKIKALLPRAGAVASIGFEADGGFESVSYNYGENRSLDASKPLTILDHVGGDPIGFYASRNKPQPADEEVGRLVLSKLGEYFDRIAVPFMDEDQQELYRQLREKLLPLLKRLDTATQQQLTPALADGQSAIVLDAQLTNTQWHMAMPAADEALPLPEIACVFSVSDPQLLKAGAAEYFAVLQDSVKALREIMPDNVPPIELPKPKTRDFDTGTIYYYEIPPIVGLDAAIAPNAGLSDKTFVMSMVPKATLRLLEAKSPEAVGLLAEARERPLGSVWQFKTDRFVQMIRPWVNYGLKLAEEQGAQEPMVATHVTAVLDVLECIRTCHGISYVEDGAVVSHVRTEFKDLSP